MRVLRSVVVLGCFAAWAGCTMPMGVPACRTDDDCARREFCSTSGFCVALPDAGGDAPSSADAGSDAAAAFDAGLDGGLPDAPVTGCVDCVRAGGRAPDLTCLGTRSITGTSPAVPGAVRIVDLTRTDAVSSSGLLVAAGHRDVSGCTTCTVGSRAFFLDGAGMSAFALVGTGPDTVRHRWLGQRWRIETFELVGIDRTTHTSLLALLEVVEPAVVVRSTAVDCAGVPLENVRFRAFIMEPVSLELTDFITSAFEDGSGALDRGRTRTTERGVAVGGGGVAAVGTGTAVVRVEPWGIVTEALGEQRLGCEVVAIEIGGVSVVELGPLRGDYEAGSLCLTP